ncbi:oligosaccharide flippase family protein [Altererythrobacter soli]|uniref:Oligosaccharide flippase family protein n=1 Tax=Croceibacterium soli TaxID=1739690 RepID=A0A6I4UR36_9SPHN|nr:lipopolysaccharide biosynthesis protein [Croceibacterium soli]MXP41362.1 oligosaccharide flippase family protein [Croceibacterium soli]
MRTWFEGGSIRGGSNCSRDDLQPDSTGRARVARRRQLAMSLRLGIIRGSLSLAGARIAVSLGNALGILVLARILTPADFGIVAISTALISIVMAVTEASLQPALIQSRNPTPDHVDTVWSMSLIRAGLIFAIFLASAWPLAALYGDQRLVGVLIVSGVTGAFMEFYNPHITLATRTFDFRPLVTFQILQKFGGLALAIGLALWFRSFWAIIVGNAVGTLAASLASYLIAPYRPRWSLSRVGEIWGFSRWMFLNQLCETLNWRFDQLIIGLTVTRAQLGFYSVADSLAVIPSRELSAPISSAIFPGLANIAEKPERLRGSFRRAQSAIAMITVPAAVGLALVAEPAVTLLLGEKWLAATVFVQILSITYAFDMFIIVVRPLGMAMGETRLLFFRQLLGLGIRVPLIVLGLVFGGLVGAALGRAFGSAINCFISFFIADRLVGVPVGQQLRDHLATFTGTIAMATLLLFLQAEWGALLAISPIVALAVLVPAGAATYGIVLYLLWQLGGRREGPVTEIVGATEALLPVLFARRAVRS